MHEFPLVLFLAALTLAFGLFSRLPERMPFTAPMFFVAVGLMLPPVIVALYDPGSWSLHLQDKFAYIIGTLSSVLAMGLYSFLHYYKIGPISQSWREGTSGQTWDKIIEFNPKMHPGLPRGLLPALFATARVFVVGMLPIVAMLKVDQYLPVWFAIIPGLLWLGWNVIKARRTIPQFDRIYYHTNAFYEELFTRGSIRISDRAPVSYDEYTCRGKEGRQ